MAERCGLFVIIALGELILVTGATFATLAWTAATVAAFLIAFIGSVAMWWIYFNIGAERGSRLIAARPTPDGLRASPTPTSTSRSSPASSSAPWPTSWCWRTPAAIPGPRPRRTVLGGPALYLAGNLLFKRATADRVPLSHLAALLLLVLLVPLPMVGAAPGLCAAAATLVLVLVAIWGELFARNRPGRGARRVRWPLER